MKVKFDGFSLLEVLIALVILALAFSTAYLTLSTSAKTLFHLENKTAATWVGMNALLSARLGLVIIPETTNELVGSEQMLGATWQWKLSRVSTSTPHLGQIDVAVHKIIAGYAEPTASIRLTSFIWIP